VPTLLWFRESSPMAVNAAIVAAMTNRQKTERKRRVVGGSRQVFHGVGRGPSLFDNGVRNREFAPTWASAAPRRSSDTATKLFEGLPTGIFGEEEGLDLFEALAVGAHLVGALAVVLGGAHSGGEIGLLPLEGLDLLGE
jgi:hypothetical protein